MRFYPFFLECSKRETIKERKKQLEFMAFGKCCMIVDEDDGTSTLVKDKEIFRIPNVFNDMDRDRLNAIMWGECSDFDRMEHAIKESVRQWSNVKKRDKLRIIDKYVLGLDCDLKEKKLIKSIINIALILRMIHADEIVYQDFEIKNIEGTFDCNYFTKASEGHVISRSSVSQSTNNKVSSRDIWKKVCGNTRVV